MYFQICLVESESDTERNMQGLGEGRRISSGLTEVIHCAFDFNLASIVLVLYSYWIQNLVLESVCMCTPFSSFCHTSIVNLLKKVRPFNIIQELSIFVIDNKSLTAKMQQWLGRGRRGREAEERGFNQISANI